MKIELEVTFRLHPDLVAMLAPLFAAAAAAAPMTVAAVAAPAASNTEPAAEPVKRGPGRPRKDAPTAVAPVAATPAPTTPQTTAPVAPAASSAPTVTLTELAKKMTATMKTEGVGVGPVRALLQEFGIAALPELKPPQFADFGAKLDDLVANAGS